MGNGEDRRKQERASRTPRNRNARQKRLQRRRKVLGGIVVVALELLCVAILLLAFVVSRPRQKSPEEIQMPQWIKQDFIRVNPYSRPGDKMGRINGIVIHYVGNPETTARQNRDFFDGLANQTGAKTTSVSSNFVIGMDGEIIQCIPMDEIAYASNDRNFDTISIECCHPDTSGKFTDKTYDSLVKLTAWLCSELGLSEKDVMRHYDVTGKKCPMYFAENEDSWVKFRSDVAKARKK